MSETDVIRVLIVDDHAMVRSGLKTFIYSFDWMKPIGEAKNGLEAVEFCAANEVDVVLMDLVMPVMNGSEATRRIIELGTQTKVVILTSFHESNLVEDALRAGATSYILKNVSSDELALAVRAAHAGRATLAPEATDVLIQATRQKPGIGFDLTERERETLYLLSQGMLNRQISEELSISMPTVKFHLTNIFSKLGAKNRVEAVTIALENHLLDELH